MKKSILIIPLVLATVSQGAVTLATDDFTYPDGALTSNPSWSTHSGTAGTLGVVGGAASVTEDGGSEDANISFAAQTSGIVTATFDISVSAPGAMTGTDFEYFAHFNSSGFRSRIDVQVPNGAGDFTIGLATLGGSSDIVLPVDFAFNTTIPIVLTFDIDNGLSSVTAGGQTVTSSVVSLGQTISAFSLRQSNSSSDETILVDNLVVMGCPPVPEPSTALLSSLALFGLARRRR